MYITLNYDLRMAKKTTVQTLADNLKHLMRLSGMTQAELIRRSGVSRRTVAYILKGENATSIENAELLAKPFGLEGWHLIMPTLPNDIKSSKAIQKLVSDYIQSSEGGKDMISMIAEREARYGGED